MEVVKLLLNDEADVNACGTDGSTTAYVAGENGHNRSCETVDCQQSLCERDCYHAQ